MKNKDFNGNIIELKNDSKIKLPLIILFTTLIFISFCLPVLVIIFGKRDIGFGFVFTIFAFFGTGIYLLRLILWNLYGKEVFLIENQSITYYTSYKYFNDNKTVLKSKDCRFFITYSGNSSKGVLIIESNEQKLKSCIEKEEKELLKVIKDINRILKTHLGNNGEQHQ